MNFSKTVFFSCWFFFVATLIFSCRQIDVYEMNKPIPAHSWSHVNAVNGSFVISDTTDAYHIYVILRHTDAYRYNNIWLKIGLQAPGDTMFYQDVNLPLASDAEGWEGSGMNDIWEVRKLLNAQPRRFKKTGEYKFNISHIMRDDPLKHILSAGLRIQKSF